MPIIDTQEKGKNDYPGRESRRYLRLDTVFPVQFFLVSLDGKEKLSGALQGFTNNLSKGGICLSANNLPAEVAQLLKIRQAKISLSIELPVLKKPIDALAAVSWMKEDPGYSGKILIGLCYERIDPLANNKLMRYARSKKLFAPLLLGAVVLLGAGLVLNSFINAKLAEGNRALIRKLSEVIAEANLARQNIKDVTREKALLQEKISSLEERIQGVEDARLKLKNNTQIGLTEQSRKINELSGLIQQLLNEKGNLKKQLASAQVKEDSIAEELGRIDKKREGLEKENFEKMYQWVKAHQNPSTGLVMSFEGDSDIGGWAFTYDQSLAAQAFTTFGDLSRAAKVLDFFNNQAKKKGGLFFNAYYAGDGAPVEYILHSGPNLWLGIAAGQYTHKSKERKYLGLAEEIAEAIIALQKQDADGGIRGGPDVFWYSTEHNLDAYAFFNMLYSLTAKEKYMNARDKTLAWLVKHTYDRTDIPVKRGKGDATIATDTYAWSIAAIGPEKLASLGMNPDEIMQFAENTCSVKISYVGPEGQKIEIKGFDFAPQRHVGRGGVVSSEWTAQMVISYKIMADYYLKKGLAERADNYKLKADEYLASLVNMITCSPSASGQGANCLPYATQDFIDTGHGWFTPKGKSTGSVSGTTYTIFAYYNYNPLEFK